MKTLEIQNLLKSKKLKVTPKRMLILNLLIQRKSPITVQSISKILSLTEPTDQVTVYRNMHTLLKSGLIKEFSIQKGLTHYEYDNGHTHHHIICSDCGVIEDFTICEAKKIAEKVLQTSKKFKEIKRHSFELFGVCNICTNK